MNRDKSCELPIRAKKEMACDVAKIIRFLHFGLLTEANEHIRALKIRAVHLEEQIQQDVLVFSEQVQFQFAYDPWHRVNKNVQIAADNLLIDLGLINPHFRLAS